MEFVYPAFLAALSAIAIPIIIHLFHFRRYKKIIFSDIRFLKQVQEQNKSKQKLKDILVLISRILAIIFLVLAFAQPYLPAKDAISNQGQKSVSIFIDNSFSMNHEGADGNLLEVAKNKARTVVNAFDNDDQFQILTHDFEGKHQRLVNKQDALSRIDEIMISPASVQLSKILKRQKQALEKSGNTPQFQYIVSDFQAQMCDNPTEDIDTSVFLTLLPVTANKQHNISVDSVWIISPVVQVNQPMNIRTRIRCHGTEPAENIAVTLSINGQQKGLQHIHCDAGGFADLTFSYTPTTPEWHSGEISIMDYPIVFDDHLYFSFNPVQQYSVLVINGGPSNTYITTLFGQDPLFSFSEAAQSQLNYAAFPQQQLIILNNPVPISSGLSLELKKYISQGGQVLCLPPENPQSLVSLNTLLDELSAPHYGSSLKQQLKVGELNLNDPLFSNVFARLPKNMDLPSVSEFYALQRNQTTRGKALMMLANGQPFVWQTTYQKGNLVLLATLLTPTQTNFAQHALYVPFMLKLGTGKPKFEHLFYTIGHSYWIPLTRAVTIDKLVQMTNGTTQLVLQTQQHEGKTAIYLDYVPNQAGIYSLTTADNQQPFQPVALNFNRIESGMQTWPKDQVETFLSRYPNGNTSSDNNTVLQNTISNQLNGTPFWRYCIWLALVFVLIEILLLRLIKN